MPGSDEANEPSSREIESDLRARIAELEDAVAARDAFVSIVGHELRNPMTPIQAQAGLLLRLVKGGRATPERLIVGLERIEWLIDRYVARATTLLDVTRANAGKLKLRYQPVHLATAILEVCTSLGPLAAHSGSTLTVDVSDAVRGHWDVLAIEQIVENLLTNAIKYGAGKPVAIDGTADHETALICVRDNGVGMSDADQSRMFERFERVMTPGDTSGGFGIGLWLVRQLVEAMGGSIAVSGKLGEGTTFCVTLPLALKGAA